MRGVEEVCEESSVRLTGQGPRRVEWSAHPVAEELHQLHLVGNRHVGVERLRSDEEEVVRDASDDGLGRVVAGFDDERQGVEIDPRARFL